MFRRVALAVLLTAVAASLLLVAPVPQAEAVLGGGGFWATYHPADPLGCSGPPRDCYVIIVVPS